jgi:tRNA modification GTPase
MPVIACDTAGLRDAASQDVDVAEKIGMEKASEVIKDADVALCVLSVEDILPSILPLSSPALPASAESLSASKLPFPIPIELRRHVTSHTLFLINKFDLLPPEFSPAVSPSGQAGYSFLDKLSPRISAMSIQQAEQNEAGNGGLDAFLERLVEVLKQKCVFCARDGHTIQLFI